jgi:hypothetical protein
MQYAVCSMQYVYVYVFGGQTYHNNRHHNPRTTKHKRHPQGTLEDHMSRYFYLVGER